MDEIGSELVQAFLQLSIKEFEEKSFGSTTQYLEVLDIVKENTIPVIERVEKLDIHWYALYFPVKNQRFFYTHFFEVNNHGILLIGDNITPASEIYLRVYSSELSLEKMLAATTLKPVRVYRKGTPKGKNIHSTATYKESRFDIQIDNSKAGDVEVKLYSLLEILENYGDELKYLRTIGCDMYITVYWESYIGNTMLGGFYFGKHIINKLHKLGLEINFDLYTSGTPIN